MPKLLQWRIGSESWDRRIGWGVGFVFLAICTTLILKMLPEFSLGASIGLVSCVALAWVIMAWVFPQAIRVKA